MGTRTTAGVCGVLFACAACSGKGSALDASPAGGAPGLTAAECPGTPASLALARVAPFYGGLFAITFTVPGGAPDGFEVEELDPARKVWTDIGSQYSPRPAPTQTADGKYVVYASPPVTPGNADLPFALRVRSVLQGCPPSAWTETGTFGMSDPFSGSTWTLAIDPGLVTAQLTVSSSLGATQGPYAFSATNPASHAITFNADGSSSETVKFTLTSPHAGDTYGACAVELHIAGQWRFDVQTGLLVTSRQPAAPATAGSQCASPDPGTWAISQGATLGILAPLSIAWPPPIDYTPLLETPPRPATMQPYVFGNVFQQALALVAVHQGYQNASVQGSVALPSIPYTKQ